MRNYLAILVVALAVALLSSCRQATPPEKGTTSGDNTRPAPSTNQTVPAKKGPVPDAGPGSGEPVDPLAGAAKALPAGKVRVELTRSQPAGAANERAEYEWTILTHTPLADIKNPRLIYPKQKANDARRHVLRLTLRAEHDKRDDDVTWAKQAIVKKPGVSHVSLYVHAESVYVVPGQTKGTGQYNNYTAPGAGLTLVMSAWPDPSLQGQFTPFRGRDVLLEVRKAPLDEFVRPLFKGPETMDLPRTLELLQVGDRKTKLELVP
jgi:hypothetical protein